MIYESIPGWFTFADIYRQAVDDAKDGDVFVELGTFLGRSAAFMAETIKDSGKKIKFYTVDDHNFYRGLDDDKRRELRIENFTHTIDTVKENLSPLSGFVEIVAGTSWEGIPGVETCDFCWIDASHDYEMVKKDIEYWLPRSRVIGGDDYGFEGVKKAVDELIVGAEVGQHWLLNPNPYFK